MKLIKDAELFSLIGGTIENHEGKYISYIKIDSLDASDFENVKVTKDSEKFVYEIPIEKIQFTYCLSETKVEGTHYDVNKTYILTGKQLNYFISEYNSGKTLYFYAILPSVLDALGSGSHSIELAATWKEDKLLYSEQDYLTDNWKDLKRMVEELFDGWKLLNNKEHVDIMRKCIDDSYVYNRLWG